MSLLLQTLCIVLFVLLGGARRTGRRCFDCHGTGSDCAYPVTVSNCMVHEFTCSTIVTETTPDQENPDAKVYNVIRQCGRGPLAYKALVPRATYPHSTASGTRCVSTTDTDAEGGGMIVECWCQTDDCNHQETVTLPDGTSIQLAYTSEQHPLAYAGQSSSDDD